MCKRVLASLLILVSPAVGATPTTTEIIDPAAAEALIGAHRFGLQWISWTELGRAGVTIDDHGLFHIYGTQTNPIGSDPEQARQLLLIDGVFSRIEANLLYFEGVIDIRLGRGGDHSTCRREGKLTFRYRGGKSPTWRLQQMQNPCIDHVDYVDIHIDAEWQPLDIPVHQPTRAQIWGLGGLFIPSDFRTNGPPGSDQFPDHPLTLYDAPSGNKLGQLHYDREKWHHYITTSQADEAEIIERSQLREVGYESVVLTANAIAQDHFNILVQTHPGGYWISRAEAQPLTLVRWIDYLASYRQGGLFPIDETALHLRRSASPDSESLAVMRGDLYDLTPTGTQSGNWIEVDVKLYTNHPCTNADVSIAQRWRGWVKAADDAGFPNLWYRTRGC